LSRSAWVVFFCLSLALGAISCSDDSHGGSPDGGDTDTDTDSDTDGDTDTDSDTDSDSDEWCPVLATSCGEPTALESCGDDTLNAPRLIAPLSGKYVRDRRPEIIWDGAASGVSQYRVEIARDRAFTEVVYRSTTYEAYPGINNRFRHIVTCDLDCGVHFFRVMSVTSPECEVGTPTYTWEMYVGMAPYDMDRDGVPDIMCWHVEPASGEFENDLIQGYAFFDLDENTGEELTSPELVIEIETEPSTYGTGVFAVGLGDVNGDSKYDIGLIAYENNGDSNNWNILVFTDLSGGSIRSRIDAFVDISGPSSFKSGLIGGVPFSFNDINGDGKSDIGLKGYYLVSSGEDPQYQVQYFLGNTIGGVFDISESDFSIVATDPTISEAVFGLWTTNVDVNGDGFADVISEAEGYDAGVPLSSSCSVIHFGAQTVESNVGVFDNAALIGRSEEPVLLGAWDLGTVFGGQYPVLEIAGDIDFDGYPELLGYLDAFDSDEAVPIVTGGYFVANDIAGPEQSSFSDMLDVVFVGDFTIFEEENTELLHQMEPMGDQNSDNTDDLLMYSDQGNEYLPYYPGRVFTFSGRQDWNDLYSVSSADTIAILLGEGWYLDDIDGDGIPEKASYNNLSGYSGLEILLSADEEILKIPTETIQQKCDAGILFPRQLM
jgi:hypothetical protein